VGPVYLAVARGTSPKANVEAVIKALGGIEQFVKPGNDVIVKPNICTDYNTYEYAATTNPEVVGTIVSLCKAAGAKRVRVMDYPFGGTAADAYSRSGIADAVKAAGGEMEIMSSIKFKSTPFPEAVDIKTWPVYTDILTADVVINVPVAKNHNLTVLTLAMKNLMGVVENRNQIHINSGQRIADIASLVKPELNIIDCTRIMISNGPTGGSMKDVKVMNTVIASRDIVAADAYAATLFGKTGASVPAIVAGAKMGLGKMDLTGLKIEEINA
jgi:uncharacterized protein (DUF362 family)